MRELVGEELLALFILVNDNILSFAILVVDRSYFPFEGTTLLSSSCLLVRSNRELVLSFTSDSEFGTNLLSAGSHENFVVDVSESVALDGVKNLEIAVANG